MPKPLNFYVFITYDNLTQNCFRISIEFKTTRHKQILLNDIILTVSDGKNWPMGWKILSNGHLWLQKGWLEFAKHYHIKIPHLLLFNHQENSNFHIRMFDRDSCEITYFPFTKAPQMEKEIDHTVLQKKSSFQQMEVSIELASKQRPKERALTSAVVQFSAKITGMVVECMVKTGRNSVMSI